MFLPALIERTILEQKALAQSSTQTERDAQGASLVSVLVLVAAFSLATGYSYPAMAFNMEARGYSATVIGLQAACAGLGIAGSAGAAPLLAQRYGIWRLSLIGVCGTAASILAFGLTESLILWFLLRVILGAMVNILFVVTETWINLLAPENRRGRFVAAYTAVNAAMFAAGVLLVPLIGYSGMASFGIMGAIVALLGLSLIKLRPISPALEVAPNAVALRIVIAMPVLVLAVVAFGFFDGSILSLWVVYGLHHGLDGRSSALSLWAIMMGNVLLQFPIGWLADRISRRNLLALLALVAFAGALLLPVVPLSSWFGIAYLVIWGGAAFGVYTLALTIIGQNLRGVLLVAGTAAFGMAWGVGSLLGPWVTGGLMDFVGPAMLPMAIAAIYGCLTLAAIMAQPIRTSLILASRE